MLPCKPENVPAGYIMVCSVLTQKVIPIKSIETMTSQITTPVKGPGNPLGFGTDFDKREGARKSDSHSLSLDIAADLGHPRFW